MPGSLIPSANQRFYDANGKPLVGGKITTYSAGTASKKSTFQDRALSAANTNPVTLDARGEAIMYGTGVYRLMVKAASGALIYDRDNVEVYGGVLDAIVVNIADVEAARAAAIVDIDADVAALDAYRVAGSVLIDADTAAVTTSKNTAVNTAIPAAVAVVDARKIQALVVDIPAAIATVAAINNRGVWVAATAYSLKDIALTGGTWYLCIVAHTSSADFATDTTSKWRVYQETASGLGANVQVVGAGDSIMAGMTSPNTISIPTALKAYYKPLSLATLTNDGVPGAPLFGSASGMVERYAAYVYPKRPAATGADRSILLVCIGANNFSAMANDAAVATWCSTFDAYCATARADGFVVVAFTIMKRGNANDSTTLAENRRMTMNDFIRRSKNIDGYVDSAELITVMSDLALVIDGTHPTDAGNRLLARATASEIARAGVRIGSSSLPAANLRPTMAAAAAAVALLERAAIQSSDVANNSASGFQMAPDVPALGAGDFTLSWWDYFISGTGSTNSNKFTSVTGDAGGAFGVLWDAAKGLGQIYSLPGSSATWGPLNVFPDVWNSVHLTRAGTLLTYYLNGVPVGTTNYTTAVSAMHRLLSSTVGTMARPRMLSRAMSAAEVAADTAKLSEYSVTDNACVFALDDGANGAGNYLDDLSASKSHVWMPDTAKWKLKRPGSRGAVRMTTVGSAVFTGAPVGSRIASWTVNVPVAGGGVVNIGDANGNGSFFNAALTIGRKDLVLASNFPINSNTIYCNATGYTLEHRIIFEMLR